MKGREEKMGEQWKGKVAHHRKGNKKRKYYWLRSVCKTDRKSSALCAHASANPAPHASHPSWVTPFQGQRDAIKASSDIMSIARSFAEMKEVLWVSNRMWYVNTNLAEIPSSFSLFVMIIAKDVLLLKVWNNLHLTDAPREKVFYSLLLGFFLVWVHTLWIK